MRNALHSARSSLRSDSSSSHRLSQSSSQLFDQCNFRALTSCVPVLPMARTNFGQEHQGSSSGQKIVPKLRHRPVLQFCSSGSANLYWLPILVMIPDPLFKSSPVPFSFQAPTPIFSTLRFSKITQRESACLRMTFSPWEKPW